MQQKKILKNVRSRPIRVKGLWRAFARIAGWLHARKNVITLKENQLQSPFFSAQAAHYAAFAAKDRARIEELLSDHKKRYTALTCHLETLKQPVPEACGDSPEANAYRYQKAVSERQAQICRTKEELETISELIWQCQRIYEDRCAHARSKVNGRISAYLSGAARALKAQGIDCNTPTKDLFPPARLLTTVFKTEKEATSA